MINFETGKTIDEKEEKFYASSLKILQESELYESYKLDPIRINRFISNNNIKMLKLLSFYEYFIEYLKIIGREDILKTLEIIK